MLNTEKIIGKKIIAIKGYDPNYYSPHAYEGSLEKEERLKKIGTNIDPVFILFDDEETFMELDYQDEYVYHDCDNSARTISIYQNKERWNKIMINEEYGNADKNLGW